MNASGWFCLLLTVARVHALVFPLPPDEEGEYDVTYNVLPSLQSPRASGHAVLNFHGANGVAIAPHWFITAGHLVSGKDTNYWANDGLQRYYVVEHHSVGHDLSVVRVDRPFPDYSELLKTPVPTNEILTIYGQSAAGGDPIYNEQGEHAGWKVAPLAHFPRLRWGRLRPIHRANASPGLVQWAFRPDDPEVGLNCAGTSTNDSGEAFFRPKNSRRSRSAGISSRIGSAQVSLGTAN